MSPYNPPNKSESQPFYTRAQAQWMDALFCRAMIAARRAGNINFKLGIVVDESPLVSARFARPMVGSGMSSAGGVMADIGGTGKWA
jgi:hypothetical protein